MTAIKALADRILTGLALSGKQTEGQLYAACTGYIVADGIPLAETTQNIGIRLVSFARRKKASF